MSSLSCLDPRSVPRPFQRKNMTNSVLTERWSRLHRKGCTVEKGSKAKGCRGLLSPRVIRLESDWSPEPLWRREWAYFKRPEKRLHDFFSPFLGEGQFGWVGYFLSYENNGQFLFCFWVYLLLDMEFIGFFPLPFLEPLNVDVTDVVKFHRGLRGWFLTWHK